jgi:hypothetical protein
LVVTTYTIHLPQDSYLSKSEQGLNIGPTHGPGRREAAELSTEILDQFLEFINILYIHENRIQNKGVVSSSIEQSKQSIISAGCALHFARRASTFR